MSRAAQLVICSKSTWHPSIRREHELARLASAEGHAVRFLEQPADLRQLRRRPRKWMRGWLAPRAHPAEGGIAAEPRSTLVPGHRGRLARAADNLALAGALRRGGLQPGATVVCMTPWQWPAVSRLQEVRRVFDCTDDWSALIWPGGDRSFEALHRRIAHEADAIVVVNPTLARLFPGGATTVVPNAVDESLVRHPPAGPVEDKSMVYVGTLSHRFDSGLVAEVLGLLPEWRLDLYGLCRYPGRGDRPGPELDELLRMTGGRVSWRGPIERSRLPSVLDRAAVLVLPNRARQSSGQDSMKLYDYAARGRPIVSTTPLGSQPATDCPHVSVARDAGSFAAAVECATHEPAGWARARRDWARANSWSARWPAWRVALFGETRAEPPQDTARLERDPRDTFG